jgi:hypothetical protein
MKMSSWVVGAEGRWLADEEIKILTLLDRP